MPDNDHHAPDNAFLGPLKGGSMEPAFGGALSFMRRRYTHDLTGVDVAILGAPFDQATSYRAGTRFGPQAIRRASAIFEGDPQYPFGIDPFARLTVIDYGDAAVDFSLPSAFPATLEATAAHIIGTGTHLFTLGGDHSITYALLRAHVARHGPLAFIQFDAHQDTWEPKPGHISHGSFVAQAVAEGLIEPAASIQVGIRTHAPETCGIDIVTANDIDDVGVSGIAERIIARVGGRKTYLTFDIDALDPAFAPGTGTPVAGGLSSREALSILRALGPVDLVGGDVVEVSPPYDHADLTAIAASTVAMVYLGLLAEKRGS